MQSQQLSSLPSKLQSFELLMFAIQQAIEDVEITPMNQWVFDTARQNDKRPAKIYMYAPDEWVKNLRGMDHFRDVFLVVRVPREVLNDHVEAKINEMGDENNTSHQEGEMSMEAQTSSTPHEASQAQLSVDPSPISVNKGEE